MKQTDLGLDLNTRRTRKMELLELMNRVVPWPELVSQLTAVSPPKTTGRPPFGHETMLRLHLLQQLFGLSDFAMEEALFETPLYREFTGLDANGRLPENARISMAAAQIQLKWNPSDP
jgi:IS5 family transposase